MNPQNLAPILATALDAVVVMRADGMVVDWNAVAEQVFGWERSEVLGRAMSELIIPPQHRAAHEQGLARYLATGEGPVLRRRIEITAVTRDGREIPVELSITPVAEGGKPVFLGFIRDISERKQAEAALAREKAALEREVIQRQETERHQALLLAEMNHRVKNMLAVVTGVASQTARHSSSVADFVSGFSGRLAAMSRTYGLVTEANWQATDLGTLAHDQLSAHANLGDGRARLTGPPVALPPRLALSLSMILHELIINAVKYGAFATPEGRVDLAWEVKADDPAPRLCLTWLEHGVGEVAPPSRTGFGSKMIEAVVRHELHGRSTREWSDDGLHYRMDMPLPPSVK